jgi:hypothetical protein
MFPIIHYAKTTKNRLTTQPAQKRHRQTEDLLDLRLFSASSSAWPLVRAVADRRATDLPARRQRPDLATVTQGNRFLAS